MIRRFVNRAMVISVALVAANTPVLADLPAPVVAKLLVLVSKGIGQGGRVATKEQSVAAELKNMGTLDGSSRVTYATTEPDVKADVAKNNCVICSDPKMLERGAVLALVEDGGKPKFIISRKNMEIFGITFPDSVLRTAVFQ